MDIKSAWTFNRDEAKSSQPIFDYIESQINMLKNATDGKVIALLDDTHITNKQIAEALSTLSRTWDSIPLTINQDEKDASKLYEKHTKSFYITDKNNKYELFVFSITGNDELPVLLEIDETIAEEAGLEATIEIRSEESFKEAFDKMVQTHKVNYIINRLMAL